VARVNFTKHRRWTDAAGVNRPASSHALYTTWAHMRSRCLDTRHPRYADYGGRGVQLDPHWATDPVAFFEWVAKTLGPRPPGRSLDRINNDGNYEPGNLRWADAAGQAQNRRPREAGLEPCPCFYSNICDDGAACPLDALPWAAARAALWPEGSPG
jgi:hypothetical protein